MLAINRQTMLVIPSGANLDGLFERFTLLNIYAGFAAGIGSVGTSAGSRQRLRTLGLLSRA